MLNRGHFFGTLFITFNKNRILQMSNKKLHISSKILHNLWCHNFKFYWKGKAAYFYAKFGLSIYVSVT